MLNYLKRHSNYVAVLIGFLVGIFVLKKYKDKFDFKNDRIIVLVSFLFSVFSVVSALMLATVEELISYGTFHVGSVATYGVYLICPLFVFIICRLMKMNVRKTFDAYALYAIPSLILLRINCIFSGCCTGRPFFKTGMLWPTREIEILFYLIVLYKFVTNEMKQLSRNGDMFPKLMLYYGAFRFVEEFFRSSFVSSVLPLTHIWSGVCIMIGFFMSKKRFSFSKTLICILTLVLSLFGSITSASVSAETKGSLPVVSDVSGTNETKAIAEAVWTIGSTSYTGLSAALSAAKNGDVIVLAADGTLSSGTYTIPGGVTLLIPYNADNTVSTSSNYAVVGNEYPDPTDYRTLTMESGANIIVNGKLNVGSAISARGQGGANTGTFSANGTPTGPHGKIVMNSGSNITVNNGAELFCFGYITGPDNTSGINDGTVTVKSGGIVREPLQIRDWRGGSFTKTIYDNRATWKCFPFSQYYVQNVEVPMTFESGSTEYVYSAVYVSDSVQKLDNVVFLGNNGLFSISSGSITRTYKSGDDTIHYDVNGNTSLNKISATITVGCTSISLDSSAYVLPITNNVVINVHSGTTTLTQDVQFLPGSEVHIDKGANLSISKNAYVFDNTEWGNFVFSELKSTVLTYTAATRGQRKALKDVIIDVNGTVNVNGNLYTTSNGADICSKERTGQVLLNSAPADGSLYEIVNGADGTAISITPAKLHNGSFSNTNDEYIETAGSVANDKYLYSNRLDRWNEKNHVSIVYDINDGSQKPQVSGQSVGINELATIAGNPFIREGFRFVEWNTKADGSGTSYSEGDSIKTTDEIVLYAIWSDSHEHIWCDPTWTWSRDYTQVTAHFVCSENESHIQDIAATVEHVHQDSTCMEEGFDKYTATVNLADKSYSDVKEEILPLADHTPSDPKEENRTEPTCTQDGGYDQVTYCTVCDNELSRIHHMLPATGHTAGETVMENVHEPTCTTEGSHEEVAYCISCGIELSRKEVSDPALGHLWKYVDYTVNEDYTEVIFNYVCEHDGSHKVSVKGVITVTDHIEPTCTTEGSFLVSVSIDKDTAPDGESRSDGKTVKIPALGHTLELLKGKDATCVLTGIKDCYECSTCHHKFLDAEGSNPVEKEEDLILEALGHDFGEWKQINAPTCTENGVEERECSRCHEKETRSIEASGHKAGEAVKENIVESTCTEKGSYELVVRCSVCNEVIRKDHVESDVLGHDWEFKGFTWSDDYGAAEGRFVCTRDNNHVRIIEAEIEKESLGAEIKITATLTGPDGMVYTEYKTIEGDNEVIRVYGETRYYTGIKTAQYLAEVKGVEKFDRMVITTGENFADALAGSYLANKYGAPIILMPATGKQVHDDVVNFINDNISTDGKVYVLGGTNAVSDERLNAINRKIERIQGATRYITNINVLKKAGYNGGEILVCTGNAFADSLSASAVNIPVLLVKEHLIDEQKAYLKQFSDVRFTIIGGTAAVSGEIEKELAEYGTVTERIAGSDRFATSAKMARKFFPEAKQAVLAYGRKFPDGLSGGPLAYTLKSPLLLAESVEDNIVATADYCADRKISSGIVLGGPTIIQDGYVRKIFALYENTIISEFE